MSTPDREDATPQPILSNGGMAAATVVSPVSLAAQTLRRLVQPHRQLHLNVRACHLADSHIYEDESAMCCGMGCAVLSGGLYCLAEKGFGAQLWKASPPHLNLRGRDAPDSAPIFFIHGVGFGLVWRPSITFPG